MSDQIFTDYEHLIIDGASDDTTLAIVNQYKREQLIVFSEPDNGLYDAMNKAVHKATGQYIMFLNAGDVFFNNETLQRFFQSQKDKILYTAIH